jgi:hypothetical protein
METSVGGDRKGNCAGDATPSTFSCSSTCAMFVRWISGSGACGSFSKESATVKEKRKRRVRE